MKMTANQDSSNNFLSSVNLEYTHATSINVQDLHQLDHARIKREHEDDHQHLQKRRTMRKKKDSATLQREYRQRQTSEEAHKRKVAVAAYMREYRARKKVLQCRRDARFNNAKVGLLAGASDIDRQPTDTITGEDTRERTSESDERTNETNLSSRAYRSTLERTSKKQSPSSSNVGSSKEVSTIEISVSEVKIEPPDLTEQELPNPIKEEPQLELEDPLLCTPDIPDVPSYYPEIPSVDVGYPAVTKAVGGFITITPCADVSRASITTSVGSYSPSTSATASISSPSSSEIQSNSVKTENRDSEIDVYCKSMAAILKLLPREVSLRLQKNFDRMITFEMQQIKQKGSLLQKIGDIVIKHCKNQMEVDDENPTVDHEQKPRQIIGVRLNKAPKTTAERGREFRARKALLKQQSKQQQKPDAIVKIDTDDIRSAGPSEDNQVPGPSEIRTIEKRVRSAEATRRWREKKRGFRLKKQAKTAAQRMREYRERKKYKY